MSILAYHMVTPRFVWGATRVTPGQFFKHIDAARRLGFRFLTLSDYLACSETSQCLAVTFDDGYESVYQYARPVLNRFNIPATVFCIPGYTGQYNTWDVNIGWQRFRHMNWHQLHELQQDGWEIGVHGLSHRDLTVLESHDIEKELSARRIVEAHLGRCSPVIAYPFGNVNAAVWPLCQTAGFRAGIGLGIRRDGVPPEYNIERVGVYLFDTARSMREKILAKNKRFYHIISNIMNVCSNGSVIVKKSSWF
ncbi:polysaccharide deacetylase family protein [candidate division KSB1 bacterium]|nr:polysaccharide deacetylase family protein [candidate division KSB1 bacterium]